MSKARERSQHSALSGPLDHRTHATQINTSYTAELLSG